MSQERYPEEIDNQWVTIVVQRALAQLKMDIDINLEQLLPDDPKDTFLRKALRGFIVELARQERDDVPYLNPREYGSIDEIPNAAQIKAESGPGLYQAKACLKFLHGRGATFDDAIAIIGQIIKAARMNFADSYPADDDIVAAIRKDIDYLHRYYDSLSNPLSR